MKVKSLIQCLWAAQALCGFQVAQAGQPVWTLTPLTATSISITSNQTSTIQYLVTNQSRKQHTLQMQSIAGINQNTTTGNCPSPFVLNYKQSCILALTVTGSALQQNLTEGPTLCEVGNKLNCYRPANEDQLHISLSSNTMHYAYFTNGNNDTITKCTIDNTTGELSSCATTGPANLTQLLASPYGITINHNFAYIASAGNGRVIQCDVDTTTAELDHCVTAATGFQSPASIAIKNNFIYIEDYGDGSITGSVSVCTVNLVTGALTSCNSTGSGFNGPQGGIAFTDHYAYFSNTLSVNNISNCLIDASSGLLSGCTLSADSQFQLPVGIAVHEHYAYIPNFSASTVTQCAINSSTGLLSSCTSTSDSFTTPNGIGVYNGYAYIENNGNSTVSLCKIGSMGALENCVHTGSSFNGPNGQIAFN